MDYTLALISGALLALSFPKFGHPACAWLALTPLVVAIVKHRPDKRLTPRRALVLGLLCGSVYFSGTLYWLVQTMTTFGQLPAAGAIFAAGMLVAYLSLFPAAFAAILARVHARLGARALLLVPSIWVTTELGRQYVWDGFPWALLGYSQVTVLPIVQIASVVGIYGVSALLALVATSAAFLLVQRSATAWRAAAATVALVAAIAIWGEIRIRSSTLLSHGVPVRVAALQGNIPQDEKWDPANRGPITERYLAMSRQALAQGATFIMWPESAMPLPLERDLIGGSAIRRLAVESKATFLVGSDQVEPLKTAAPGEKTGARYYNAAFLVKADGTVGAVYRKMHLVPFGEYVPLQSVLFFAGPIIGAVADFSPFTPGTLPVLLPVGEHVASTAICYEVIYPDLIRRFVRDGSELLTTITNDAWYGRSSAAYQHWDQASMRAIEEGRYLARAANTGISGFVDPYGRVLARTPLFVKDVVVQDVRFLTDRTIYSRIGDLVAWLSLVITAAALLTTWRLR
ncbi:MAG: apolipoprotein N-acyltransferase [Vicinamibacterales bacterium]